MLKEKQDKIPRGQIDFVNHDSMACSEQDDVCLALIGSIRRLNAGSTIGSGI